MPHAHNMKRTRERFGRSDADAIIDDAREHGATIPEPTGEPEVADLNVDARIDHGRWIAVCGLYDAARTRDCPNAQFVDEDDPRFYCILCNNDEIDGRWRDVTFPADIPVVEATINELPPDQQNWPPETNTVSAPLTGTEGV